MSYTFDEALADDVSKVRVRIGDTVPYDVQFQDETIQSFLDNSSNNVLQAAIYATRSLIAKYARFVDKWTGDYKLMASQRVKGYQALLEQLELEATENIALGYLAVPTAGGIYTAERDARRQRTDLVQPFFTRGIHDNRLTNSDTGFDPIEDTDN